MSLAYAVFGTVTTWILLRHDLQQPAPTAVLVALGASLLLGVVARTRHDFRFQLDWSIVALACVVLLVGALGFGGTTEVLLTAAAMPLVVRLLGYRVAWLERISDGGLVVTALLLAFAALQPLLHRVALDHPGWEAVAAIAAAYCDLVYEHATHLGETVYVSTGQQRFEYVANWETLALEPLVLFAVGGGLIGVLARRSWVYFASLVVGLVVFAFVRFALLVNVATYYEYPRVFANTLPLVLSLAPLAPLLAVLHGVRPSDFEVRPLVVSLPGRRLTGASLLVGVLGGVGVGVALGFRDPGGESPKTILFDEHKSEWSWTDIPLDREQYGVISVYNYRSLYDYLEYFYDVRRNEDPITAERLAGVDLLVVKMPTQPYEPAEVAAIERFVAEGGGLFVIGDHTNVFGTSTYANDVLAPFGARLLFDATYEIDYGNHTDYEAPEINPHPIVQNMPPLTFASSCTIEAPWSADVVISGYEIKAAELDYSSNNFFPSSEHVLAHPHRFGRFIQGVGLHHGKGRVSVFSDSTMFSNFCMFLEGRPELVLGYVEWTGRENRWDGVGTVGAILGVLGLMAIGLMSLRSRRVGVGVLGGIGAVAGWLAASAVTDQMAASAYPIPKPRRPVPYITFDLEHSQALEHSMKYFPIYPRAIDDAGYSTMFVWAQRAGLIPRLSRDVSAVLDDSRACVLIQPSVDFSDDDVSHFERFVEGGGTLIVLEDIWNRNKAVTSRVLEGFGMMTRSMGESDVELVDSEGGSWGAIQRTLQVAGGDPWVVGGEAPVIATKERGAGTVIVSGTSRAFSDEKLGFYKSIPNDDQKRRAGLLYRIYDRSKPRDPAPAASPPSGAEKP